MMNADEVEAARRVGFFAGTLLVGTLLVACGGGGGESSNNPLPAASTTIAPVTPVPATPTPAVAVVSGVVVDLASGSPLPGITIATSPYTVGAPYSSVAKTGSDGAFSFDAATGKYEVLIGSESAAPVDNRPTLHMSITISTGTNVVLAPVPAPYPDVTYAPSQLGGTLRLGLLSAPEQDCLNGANQGRAQLGLNLLIPDEFLLENSIALLQEELLQNTDTPVPLFAYAQPFVSPSGLTTSSGFQSCSGWTGPAYSYIIGNPPYGSATNNANIYYGASLDAGHFGAQMWLSDPR